MEEQRERQAQHQEDFLGERDDNIEVVTYFMRDAEIEYYRRVDDIVNKYQYYIRALTEDLTMQMYQQIACVPFPPQL